MLQHTDIAEASAKIPVTPEALVAAVTALEAERRAASEKISIGEALDALNLDFTPEEIYAEVQRQAARSDAHQAVPAGTPPEQAPLVAQAVRELERRQEAARAAQAEKDEKVGLIWGVALIAFVLVALSVLATVGQQQEQAAQRAVAEVRKMIAENNRPSAAYQAYEMSRIKLSRLKDGQTAYADTSDVDRIAAKDFSEGITVAKVDYPEDLGLWRLTKHGGKVYLQAYTARQSAASDYAAIYSRRAAAPPRAVLKQVTVPLAGLHWQDSVGDTTREGRAFVARTRLAPLRPRKGKTSTTQRSPNVRTRPLRTPRGRGPAAPPAGQTKAHTGSPG